VEQSDYILAPHAVLTASYFLGRISWFLPIKLIKISEGPKFDILQYYSRYLFSLIDLETKEKQIIIDVTEENDTRYYDFTTTILL